MKKYYIVVTCSKCKGRLNFPSKKGWEINIVGVIQFRHKKCKVIQSTPGLWHDIHKIKKLTQKGNKRE